MTSDRLPLRKYDVCVFDDGDVCIFCQDNIHYATLSKGVGFQCNFLSDSDEYEELYGLMHEIGEKFKKVDKLIIKGMDYDI